MCARVLSYHHKSRAEPSNTLVGLFSKEVSVLNEHFSEGGFSPKELNVLYAGNLFRFLSHEWSVLHRGRIPPPQQKR